MMNKKKILTAIISIFAVIGIKLALKYGFSYGIAEAEINASKNEKWPEDFKKEFISSCATVDPSANKNFMQKYCECATNKIEAAHIIPTKYNTIKESIQEYSERIEKIIDAFIDSEPGQNIANECAETAKKAVSHQQ